MKTRSRVLSGLILFVPALFVLLGSMPAAQHDTHRLYVAVPGIRNELQYGGVGILVYDMDAAYKLIKRIPTWDVPPGQLAENVKGIASASLVSISSPRKKSGKKNMKGAPIALPSPRTANCSTFQPSKGQTGTS